MLGNPIGFLKNISTGVKDLVEMPARGFVEGPQDLGFGLIKGAGSFIQNTVGGTFNSVEMITDSLGGGLSLLAMVICQKN